MIRKFNEKKQVKSEKFKEMQEDYRLQKMLMERQKSANERELERHMNDKREEDIKTQLDIIRKQKNKESWKGNNFNGKMTMLKEDKAILKEKNIFKNNDNMFIDNRNDVPLTQKGGMFFRW